ncbi:MAG: succinate dehydrogenase, cytochrome b556 subunit [Alphaproteobacteria bacterium]|nr:succinate dehydrogenase, cytochrome b556 subunit [Alphaproteobacteria bacterium]
MRSAERPLSPHLQVYRWQLTSVLSILHRAAGIALSAGAIVLVWWLVAAASGPDAYDAVADFLGSWLGLLLLFGWTASLFYHLCNGIRHLVWDTGYALDLKHVYAGGWVVLAAAGVLTLIAWVVGIESWVS